MGLVKNIYNLFMKVYIERLPPACECLCLQVVAEDVDCQLNGAIMYSIISGDQSNHFFIDSVSGVLKVNKQLDHERVSKESHIHGCLTAV